jgi:hypothetical protein
MSEDVLQPYLDYQTALDRATADDATAEDEVALQELEDRLPGLPDNISQDTAVAFLDIALNSSWDIPSALSAICQHNISGFDQTAFPGFGEFPMHREPQPYWNGLNPWPIIDQHFKEVHHIDLDDERINWGFDT